MKEIFEIPKLIRDVYQYEEKREPDYNLICRISMIFGAIIYAVNFKNVDHIAIVLSTYTVGTALLLVPFILKRIEKKQIFVKHFFMCLVIVLTGFMIFGINEGCSSYWAFLATFISIIVVGMPFGLEISTYFAVLSIVLFWTPVRHSLPYHYSDEYALSFPIMYLCAFALSFCGNLFLKRTRMEQDNQGIELQRELKNALDKIDSAMVDSVAVISGLIDEKDIYTKQHSIRVAEYSTMIAEKLGYGRQPDMLKKVFNAAILHDIGKISIPDKVLFKGDKLTEDEYEIMKNHTSNGETILKNLAFLEEVDIGAKYHHERFDGKGYPNQVAGNDIPLIARIISVADTFDAMNSERVYRKPCSRQYICDVFGKDKGKQFDAKIASAMIELIEEGSIKIAADEYN